LQLFQLFLITPREWFMNFSFHALLTVFLNIDAVLSLVSSYLYVLRFHNYETVAQTGWFWVKFISSPNSSLNQKNL